MNKINYCFIFFLLSVTIVGQTTIEISEPEELTGLELNAGDTVILADGEYDSDARIKFLGIGTADAPITFRPQTPGGVIFNGGLKMGIAGEYLVVDGFYWKGGYGASNFIEFRNSEVYANHCTIQNCAIDGLGVDPEELMEDLVPEDPEDNPAVTKHRWIVLYGTYNTVINCTFMNKVTAGVMVLAEYQYNASPPYDEDAGETPTNTRCLEVGHTISNNYFYNFEKISELYEEYERDGDELSNAGDSETIRIGTSEYQNVYSNVTVNNNYFVQADGENEIITNKSAHNKYVNNTFRRCRGSLVLRHGSDALVNGNYFLGENTEGTGGVRIVDSNHTITNNYIQDCVNKEAQAQWNNGITFLGGSDSNAVDCSSTSVSNGYQKVENINISNNTIINTHSPLYYNISKGSTDPTGTVNRNLIYFTSENTNLTTVITADYTSLGTALTYNDNVYNGTSLGESVTGFTEESEITVTENGEVFTITGAGEKGANLANYEPTTDAMVGHGIGACFLNYLGENIANPVCTIEIADSISISSLSVLSFQSGTYEVNVNANVSWEAIANNDWITIDTTSGTASTTVMVTVTENEESESRNGTVTFNQEGGEITRILNITQEAKDPRLAYTLINDNTITDQVRVDYAFAEEITNEKNNIKENTLDKDFGTQWSGEGDPGEIIYNLGGVFDLALVDFASTEGKTYAFEIFVSTTNTDNYENAEFVNAFPDEEDYLLSNDTGEFKTFVLPNIIEGVRYVKIIGHGQPLRDNVTWNTITEIEFYKDGEGVLSIENNVLSDFIIYPIPAKEELFINTSQGIINAIKIINLEGKSLLSQKISNKNQSTSINTSSLASGVYIIKVFNDKGFSTSKIITIQN